MRWMVRIAAALIFLIIGAFAAFQIFKDTIANNMFERVVANNAGVDRSAELADGLHVYLCGTGSPMPDDQRAGPCIGVLAGRTAFVFDAGSGSIRKLQRMAFPIQKLQAAYLTHLHSDHIDGLGELLLQAWIAAGRDKPLPVYGPEGTIEVINGFNQVYRIDSTYRIAHHGTEIANPAGFGGAPVELSAPAFSAGAVPIYEDGDVRVSLISVEHAPVEPAFGYRVDYKDRSISISGDTIYHPGFVAASKGVDIMFHEALDPEMVGTIQDSLSARGNASGAKIMHDILDYHASPEDAAKAASEAGASELVYYHIVPPLPAPMLNGVWLGDASSLFDGRMTVGEDGMFFSLPAGSNNIVHHKVF